MGEFSSQRILTGLTDEDCGQDGHSTEDHEEDINWSPAPLFNGMNDTEASRDLDGTSNGECNVFVDAKITGTHSYAVVHHGVDTSVWERKKNKNEGLKK